MEGAPPLKSNVSCKKKGCNCGGQPGLGLPSFLDALEDRLHLKLYFVSIWESTFWLYWLFLCAGSHSLYNFRSKQCTACSSTTLICKTCCMIAISTFNPQCGLHLTFNPQCGLHFSCFPETQCFIWNHGKSLSVRNWWNQCWKSPSRENNTRH